MKELKSRLDESDEQIDIKEHTIQNLETENKRLEGEIQRLIGI